MATVLRRLQSRMRKIAASRSTEHISKWVEPAQSEPGLLWGCRHSALKSLRYARRGTMLLIGEFAAQQDQGSRVERQPIAASPRLSVFSRSAGFC